MAYIKKNVNVALLLLIVLVVAAFAGVSYYYQGTYKNISQNYEVQIDELIKLTSNLSQKEKTLNKTKEELDIRTADKAKFEAMYGNLSEIKEQLAKDLEATRTELDSVKVDLANTKVQLASAQTQVDLLNIEVNTLNEQVAEKNKLIKKLKELLCPYNQTYC